MITKFFKIFLVLFSTNFCFAKPLYLDISGGEVRGIPISILPFESNNDNFVNISEIIKDDLQSSGQFYNIAYNKLEELLSHEGAKLDRFKEYGLENVVTGKIEKVGLQSYDISFELLDIYKRPSGPSKVLTPTISQKFSHVHPNNFRALAHHIADEIFYKLLGIKGIFSTKISYISKDLVNKKFSLYISDFDGHNPKKVLSSNEPIMSPAWSNDGEKLAIVAFENHQAIIKIINIASGEITRLKSFPGINGAPKWSPDDKKLALVLSKDGFPKIYTYDFETKSFERITKGMYLDTEPSWSPDGQDIIFASNRGGVSQIYKVNSITKKVKRLTFEGRYNSTPNITNDNQYLVMMHLNEKGNFNIATQSMETGEMKIITNSQQDDSPAVAPNGTMVIYSSKVGQYKKLKAVSLDGKFSIDLPSEYDNLNIQQPAWSPFLKK